MFNNTKIQKRIGILLSFIFILSSVTSWANSIPISVSYFSPFVIQPGIKLSSSFTLKSWNSNNKKHERNNHLFISPQLGFFSQRKTSKNYLINTEAGIRSNKINKKLYIASSLGIGYLISSVSQYGSVHLGTGKVTTEKVIQNRFLPTINLELGSQQWKNVGYYVRLFYGRTVAFKTTDSAFTGVELGVNFNIKNK